MKLLIVDDEPLARLRLRTLLDDLGQPAWQVVAEAADSEQALQTLRDQPADVVLLDIGLPGRNPQVGLQLATALKALPQPPAVIFVTAHAEHALAAFELEALDYLTKPVRRDRLAAALQRAQLRLDLLQGRPSGPVPAAEPVIVVNDRGRVLRLPVRDVLYLRAEQKYVTLRTADHSYVLDDALADWELRLGEGFIRVHRNALVAVRAIRALELRGPADADGWAVRVAPLDEWLAVSRRQLAAVRSALQSAGPT